MPESENLWLFNDHFEAEKVKTVEERDRKLREKSPAVLHKEKTMLIREGTSHKSRLAAANAEMELYRLETERAEKLMIKTTWISAGMGAGAAILGAVVGAMILVCAGGNGN